MYYDKQGRLISREQWHEFNDYVNTVDGRIAENPYKRIAMNKGDRWWVSTVWLGLDHGFGDGAPLIFETLVRKHGEDDELIRYSTLAEAQLGHVECVSQFGPISKITRKPPERGGFEFL